MGVGRLGPASSGPGLAFEFEDGRPLSPDSELERLFLKIDLMFMCMFLLPELEAVGSSRLIRSVGG
jgi:hypothetical protein